MSYAADGTRTGDLRKSGSHYYCTENTFDVQHQSVSNTTRIIVAAQFVDGSGNPTPFYTIDSESNRMFSLADIKLYTAARIAERASFMMWAQDYLKSTADASPLIKVNITNPSSVDKSGLCTVELEDITSADITDAMLQDPTKKSDAVTAFNKLVNATDAVDHETGHNEYLEGFKVNFYHEGVSYYQALIQHFGEHETPWKANDHVTDPAVTNNNTNDVTNIYDNNNEAMYLGRYGVVRNNWYKIEVDGVTQIGSPVVPPVPGKDPLDPNDPDTPDDTVENYLKVKINIMPWAIRKQNVTL